ncbi:MAG TPA: hypothetical protein VLL30_17245, partial [Reyranella sp.]|nr:hypothetical protein [Reyranella sp.]
MRVLSVPLSVPFLRSVIAALVDGRLVEGFDARTQPERLAGATLYLPTRRAGRLALTRLVALWAKQPVLSPLVVGGPASTLALAGDLARLIDDMVTRG